MNPPTIRTGRLDVYLLDGIAKQIVPCAMAVAGELSADWPSAVYGKILEVINRHVSAVKP